eukprot:940004-Lingulodinium_polyedra.AAC.1
MPSIPVFGPALHLAVAWVVGVMLAPCRRVAWRAPVGPYCWAIAVVRPRVTPWRVKGPQAEHI